MLLVFNVINALINTFINLSNELQNIIKNAEGYKFIVFFKNINLSLLIEINKSSITFRYPNKKEKVNLLIKLTTRDFIRLLFEKKDKLRLEIIGQASIAEIIFNLFNYIKLNWFSIILKKANNHYLNIFIRLLEITKNRILFNKYYLRKTLFKNLIYENILISKYQIKTLSKTNNELHRKIDVYKRKVESMENNVN